MLEDFSTLTNISGLGVATLSLLILWYFVRNNKQKTESLSKNELYHLDEKLNKLISINEEQIYILKDIGKKLYELYKKK